MSKARRNLLEPLTRGVLAALLVGPAAAQTPLTVQIVNDSGVRDDQVFLLLGGQSITLGNGQVLPFVAANIQTVDTGATSPNATAGSLGCPAGAPSSCSSLLQVAPLTVNSPYSGARGLPVYQFTATTLGSGTLYVSYGNPITYTAAPTVQTLPRWQLVEMSYAQQITSVGDLTSIDFFGIPIEFTTYAAGDTTFATPLSKSTYYSSTTTLLGTLAALNPNMAQAMLTTSGTTFTPGTTPIAQFARVVGPNQMAAPSSGVAPKNKGNPFPYPSFADYLDSLVAMNYTFVEQDNAVVSGYVFDYTGTISGNRTSGYTITLTGTTPAPAPLPSNATLTLNLPPNNSANGGFDFMIYGAVQSCHSMQVAGYACDKTTLPIMANSVYGWMQADVMSALNFGYMNGAIDRANATSGRVVGRSGSWYNLPPVPYPFAGARATNDGFYNPWAAVMYNHSDAYGFAFSDRNGRPSPGMALPVGGTLRLWLLPDTRLDAPLVQSTGASCTGAAAGSCSVTLQWPASSGATGYRVEVSPPYTTRVIDVPQPASGPVNTLLANLDPGTNYQIRVRAHNTGNPAAPLESTVIAVQVAMPGSPPATQAGNTSFVLGFNWNVPSYPGLPPLPGPSYAASAGMLAVTPAPSAVQMVFNPAQGTPQSTSTLTVTLPNSGAATSLTQPFALTFQPAVALSGASGTCPGATLGRHGIGVMAGSTLPAGGCSFSVIVQPNSADYITVHTSRLVLANGTTQPHAVAGLNVVDAANAPTVTASPAQVAPGTPSTFSVLLPNPTNTFATLTGDYVVAAPPGITFRAGTVPAPPCPALKVTPQVLTLAAGTAIPPGSGCYLGAAASATAAGAYIFDVPAASSIVYQGPTITVGGGTYRYNGGGSFGLSGGSLPSINVGSITSLPLQISIGSTVLWSDNLVLDFAGSPTSFEVPLGSATTPNLLVRSAGALTVNGVPGTPPYSNTPPSQPTIGVAFDPIPDKQFVPAIVPSSAVVPPSP